MVSQASPSISLKGKAGFLNPGKGTKFVRKSDKLARKIRLEANQAKRFRGGRCVRAMLYHVIWQTLPGRAGREYPACS
jgi:hypothetical protein